MVLIHLKKVSKQLEKIKFCCKEIIEVLEILIDKIDFLEKEMALPYSQPLKLHSRYTREQIFAAYGSVPLNKNLQTEKVLPE